MHLVSHPTVQGLLCQWRTSQDCISPVSQQDSSTTEPCWCNPCCQNVVRNHMKVFPEQVFVWMAADVAPKPGDIVLNLGCSLYDFQFFVEGQLDLLGTFRLSKMSQVSSVVLSKSVRF
ncbi:Hypothetical predicted protein [Xyrichtys novacula]|uniref:Uncharacterized protein n=1 Tax=Xyrichtys novacula TaxID=13765 RepID=A0AAV1EPW6_XYRNO|nr:Hypothetical predicted protein [Xyrichtys novacula]